jgi:hypothetical protein
MKRYDDYFYGDIDKRKTQEWKYEHKAGGFKCSHCRQFVVINDVMGTANRNHCNMCLWSKHVDEQKGDRKSPCGGGMEPVGLTFKHDGYGRRGEVMLVHACAACSKISINRIARDDMEHVILDVFAVSLSLEPRVRLRYASQRIDLMVEADACELRTQLYGN